jgi:hypothetical protein
MKYIAHRGNINGRFESYENEPAYIDNAISMGYDVEIDLWMNDGILYLGHDAIQYGISPNWLKQRKNKLWIHCKNWEALEWISKTDLIYFWHANDDYTLMSNGLVWVYPGKKLFENSICCMPEWGYDGDISKCHAICTDDIEKYKIN